MRDPSTKPFDPPIEVSPNNPCPFLRGLVGEGFVAGGTVPLPTLSTTIAAATGETGFNKVSAKSKVFGVALLANGWTHVLKSLWSGAQLDALRNGPLDKHGAGSRILSVDGQVNEPEIARLASFGRDYPVPDGNGVERGLNAAEIQTFMSDNLKRAGEAARWYYPLLMKFEWPVLLKIMGKGEGDHRYLSVADVRTLFVERKLPDRVADRILAEPKTTRVGKIVRVAGVGLAALILLGLAIIQFPDRFQPILPNFIAQFLAPPLPKLAETREAYWLDQNWSLEDRHWFHHVSQGTATFPVPYSWFVALEQPRINLFGWPGLLKDSAYLERFGFIPSPQTIHTDETTLRRFGYANVYETAPAPENSHLWSKPVENVDGLPVGFARMTGVVDPATGRREEDKIGLTCAACHTGHIRYKGVDVRFDGGPAMTDLKKLEITTGLAIGYTLKVWGRFDRFANRVLGPNSSKADRDELKQKLTQIGGFLLGWQNTYKKTIEDKKQQDTEEGFGRLDALNRIGNQVFSQDMKLSGLDGFEKNLHAQDAPVSFPPIWTVPWLKYAQYDASIEQPLIRNAGEALGVTALLNLSGDYPADKLFGSSVDIYNLHWIETLLGGPDPFAPRKFGGLTSPKWPSQIFGDDWKIDYDRVDRGRAIYAEICAECHLGPVNDPVFDKTYPDQSVWKPTNWEQMGNTMVLIPVQKSAVGMGTDPAQAGVLFERKVQVPGFLDVNPQRDLAEWWGCDKLPATTSTEMPYSVGLMAFVDRVIRKSMSDANMSTEQKAEVWGPRKNCPDKGPPPDPKDSEHKQPAPWYRARPLNGVWATAPYLHNGSVPSLYWLLKPAAERPKTFCMGQRDYDPKQVGFVADGEACKTGETQFSTTDSDGRAITGNSNGGHSLEGPPNKAGVIGRLLKDNERDDLIEYLKTL